MKYLKLFQNENEYLSYKDSSDYITPNVSMIFENRNIRYQKKIKPLAKVGDIAYWDGSSVKTTPLSSWNSSLGRPVGVVIIGENFIPDGKTRIISLNSLGNLQWDTTGGVNVDSTAPNFNYVVSTDDIGSTTYVSHSLGYLPSDRNDWLNSAQSYVDPLAKYNEYACFFIPSPYLSDSSFNSAYVVELDGGNVMSDFNGLSNTQLLVNEGIQYEAAQTCWNYKDSVNSNLQWYLPAMGELGFLMPRFELINQSIQAVGGTPVEEGDFWSSSECYNDYWGPPEPCAWGLYTVSGCVGSANFKDSLCRVRAVSLL